MQIYTTDSLTYIMCGKYLFRADLLTTMANILFKITALMMCGWLAACNANPARGTHVILPTCPVPSEQMLKCLGQWACQHAIRLDLRCLLNLNGNPLLGGLLGGTGGNTGGLGGLLGGGGGGGGTGIVGGLLGR